MGVRRSVMVCNSVEVCQWRGVTVIDDLSPGLSLHSVVQKRLFLIQHCPQVKHNVLLVKSVSGWRKRERESE